MLLQTTIKYLIIIAFICSTVSCKNSTKKEEPKAGQIENQNEKKTKTDQMTNFGLEYTKAWNSQQPQKVALFFSIHGSLTVNQDIPLVGREAITDFAKGFMTAFPDMKLKMDSLVIKTDETQYHWSFVGTNTGPNGTGNLVKFNGSERWTLDQNGLIKASIGRFDEDNYNRQLIPN